MNNLDNFWEARSQKYKTDPKGVLPKFLPYPLLDYLDNWMYLQVKKVLKPQRKVKILDLGCGYGRLALKIAKDYPNAHITGIDISQKYVDLFNASIGKHGKAIKGDIRDLPFGNGSFDVVIAVTTLMYMLNSQDQSKATKEIFRLLNRGGKFVIIERNPVGHNLITLGGLITLIRGKENKEIQAVGYTYRKMDSLINGSGGRVEKKYGMPFWTIFLPIEFLFSYLPFGKKLINLIGFLDKHFSYLLTPSLYILYIGSTRNLND